MAEIVDENTGLMGNRHGNNMQRNSCCHRLKKFIFSITVEPVVFLYMMAYGLAYVYIPKMWLDKVCYFHFHYSEEVCSNLETGKYSEEQLAVHRMTSRYNVYNHLIEYLPATLIVLFLGAWSDTRGRRLPIILPMAGVALMYVGLAANAFWWTLPPDYVLLAYVPVGLTGAAMTIFMGCYAYVSVNSGRRARTSRVSVIGVVSVLGATSGQAVGMVIYKYWGYVGVFLVNALLLTVAVIYGLIRLKEKPETSDDVELSENSSVRQLLSLAQLKTTLLTPFRARRNKGRCRIIGHFVAILLFIFTYGTIQYNYLFARKKFAWSYEAFTKWSIVDTCLLSLGPMVIVPVLSYKWLVTDCVIGFVGGVSLLFSYVIRGNAYEPWQLYLGSVVGLAQGLVVMASRGASSKEVEKKEVGAIFAVLGATEAAIPVISASLYNLIYIATLETLPGMIYIFTGIVGVLICCIYVVLDRTFDVTRVNVPNVDE